MKDDEKLKLDRFFVNVPAECVEDFMRDMQEDVRSAPELAAAIIVKHYRRERRLKLAELSHQPQPGEEVQEIPYFGPKPRRPSSARDEESKGGI